MRFDRLDILRYGALTDRRLSFRPDARLHIVYGPNEAGKSSALSAVSDLLFGFPERSDYGFLHDTASLRVGASVTARDGQTLTFRRRKGRKNTLLADTDGEDALSDDALVPFLGMLSRDVFQRAFGLDSGSLRVGGEMMLKSGGEIGSLLFSAASGLTGLSNLRKSLEAESDAIYSQRRSKDRRFYQVLDAHDSARKAERDNELRAADWKKILAEEAEIRAGLSAVQAEREQTKRALDRLRRLMRLEPIVREIDRESDELARYDALAALPAGFGEMLSDLLERSRRQAEAQETANTEVARLSEEMSGIKVDSALIAATPKVLAVHADKGAYLKAREDIARVGAEVDDFDQRLLQLSRRLGFPTPEALERAQPADPDLARLRELVNEGTELDREIKQIRQRVEEERNALHRLKLDVGDSRLVDPKPWADQLSAMRPDLAELSGLEGARIKVGRAEADLSAAMARLDPPVSDVELLLSSPLPDLTALSGQLQAIDTARLAHQRVAQRLAALREDAASVADQLADLEGQGRVVSRDVILAARAARDALIDSFAGKPSEAAVKPMREALSEADDLADAAIADAERLSRRAQLLLRQRELDRALSAAAADVKDADIALSDARTEFEDLFHAVPVSPAAPDRMIEWRRGVDRAIELAAVLHDAKDAFEALRLKEQDLKPALAALADAIGVTPGALPVRSLARELERRLEELASHWSERRTGERLKRAAEEALSRLEEREDQLQREVEQWRLRFAAAAATAGLPDDATMDMAIASIEAWRVVPGLISERENRLRRVRGMSRDMERFEADIKALCSDFAPDLAGLPADVAAGFLNDRVTAAHTTEDRRKTLDANLERAVHLLERSRTEVQRLHDDLAGCALQAEVDIGELLSLLKDIADRERLQAALRQCRSRYSEQSDGAPEADVRAELFDFDRIAAGIEVERLEAEDGRQVERLKVLGIAQADIDRRRQELETGIGAERAVFDKLSAEEEARDLARRWVVLKLAGTLLARSMETYRERQADPVMKRAGQLFSDLTGGRFTRLMQLYDEQDELQLAVERRTGEQVPLAGLSEGTGDQLYLALRLAFLEDYCRRNEPAPLVLDDIFQTFDDERTAAGLRTLAEAGETFQTILFTHQMSLVDAAERELAGGVDLVRLDRA
jgi:chromosome segregation protein